MRNCLCFHAFAIVEDVEAACCLLKEKRELRSTEGWTELVGAGNRGDFGSGSCGTDGWANGKAAVRSPRSRNVSCSDNLTFLLRRSGFVFILC